MSLLYFQAYIKIYQGEELPHPKSMLQVLCVLYVYLFMKEEKNLCFRDKGWKWGGALLHAHKF